ncbi:GAF domain-containing protein [Nodosilinea sp. PGN35]
MGQLSNVSPHSQNWARLMDELLATLGQRLRCDRVFLYLRCPDSQLGRVPFCWRSRPSVPQIYDPEWKPEPSSLADEDPMFAAALKAQPSIFVADVETASPTVLNRDFERATFGHRALIHAHLCSGQTLWGILQACVFDAPRQWSQADRHLIEQAIPGLTPLAQQYGQTHHPKANRG